MNKDKYVFAQLVAFLDNNKFRHLVDKYDGNRYVKNFTCWNQLIVQHDMRLKRSTYEILQILSISLTDKTPLRDLFEKTNFNDVKELDYPLLEGLFD